MNPELDVLTIGDVSFDAFLDPSESESMCEIDSKGCLICFRYGDKIPVNNVGFSVGGNAANNVVGVARLGCRGAIISSFGEDLWGKFIEEALIKDNINLHFTSKSEKYATNYSTVISYGGERTIFTYHAPKAYVLPETFPKSEYIYLTSMGEGYEEVFARVLELINERPETKLAVNPGSKQLRGRREALLPILSKTHILYVNREEAETISLETDTKGREKDLLTKLTSMGPKIVVVTDGSAGSFITNGQVFLHCPILESEVLERTGAGDAFGSAFIAALVKGKTLEEAAVWGTVNAASVVSMVGAQAGLLTEEALGIWMQNAKAQNLVAAPF